MKPFTSLAIVQTSLFSSPPEQKPGAPVFGVQAKWICFGELLPSRVHSLRKEERDRAKAGNHTEDSICTLEHADLAFLYLFTPSDKNGNSRLQCPALGFDESGDFKKIAMHFACISTAEAERRTSKCYTANVDGHGCSLDSCVTVAWKGETRAMLLRGVAA